MVNWLVANFKKFEFDDFPKSAVVNKNNAPIDNGIEDFITKAVAEHLKRVVHKSESYIDHIIDFAGNDQDSSDIGSSSIVIGADAGTIAADAPEGNAQPQDKSEENPNEERPSEQNIKSDSDLINALPLEGFNSLENIEEIKKAEFDRGFKAAQEKYMELQRTDKKDSDVVEKLLNKLSQLKPEDEFDAKVAKLSASSIALIAKKLHMVLPVNFEEILHKGIIEKLSKFYQEGVISVIVHPHRYNFCSSILHSDAIPAKFKDNFKIISDDKLSETDCRVEWKDTNLEYSVQQLSDEIDKIIERLTNAV